MEEIHSGQSMYGLKNNLEFLDFQCDKILKTCNQECYDTISLDYI